MQAPTSALARGADEVEVAWQTGSKKNRGGAESAEIRGEDLVRLVRSKQLGHRGGEVLARDFHFSPFFHLLL